jgi:hypothetical protein
LPARSVALTERVVGELRTSPVEYDTNAAPVENWTEPHSLLESVIVCGVKYLVAGEETDIFGGALSSTTQTK